LADGDFEKCVENHHVFCKHADMIWVRALTNTVLDWCSYADQLTNVSLLPADAFWLEPIGSLEHTEQRPRWTRGKPAGWARLYSLISRGLPPCSLPWKPTYSFSCH
jgi:hypothetical protein